VLRGWYMGSSPGITSQSVIYAWLMVEPESGKEDVIEKLLSVVDIERVCNYFGPRVSLVLLNESGKDSNLALERLAAATGLRGSMRMQAFIRSLLGG